MNCGWLFWFYFFYFVVLPSIVEDRIVSSLSLPPISDSAIINQHNDDGKLQVPMCPENLLIKEHSVVHETKTSDPNVQDVGSSSSSESSECSRDRDGEKEMNSNADELQKWVSKFTTVWGGGGGGVVTSLTTD